MSWKKIESEIQEIQLELKKKAIEKQLKSMSKQSVALELGIACDG